MKSPVKGLIAAAALAVAGCSGNGQGVSTSSILEGSSGAGAVGTEAEESNPTSRAFHVGVVSARAAKCGYNFDAAKLKANYLASEASLGASSADLAKIEQTYMVAYNGVTKGASGEANYCTEAKTKVIKAELTRLLAGDYNPPVKVAKKNDGGFLSGLFDNENIEQGPSFGTSDWWESQKEKAGGG